MHSQQQYIYKMLKRFQNKLLILLFVLVGGIVLYSCTKDIIEPDLSGKAVVLLSPANGFETTTLTHLFWWEEVKNASSYNLQIVSTSFSSIQSLLLDTNLTTNKFAFTLPPGLFEWRVRAFNSSSKGPYSIFSLQIDSTSSLIGQTVVLNSPTNTLLTKTVTHTFQWDTLYNADEYRLQIINNTTSQTVVDVTLTTDTARYTLSEGTYTWKVRAQNSTSVSAYSSRTLTIDITAPVVSVQSFPANKDTISGTDSLAWIRSAAAIADTLFIYPDSLVSSLVFKGYVTDQDYTFPGIINQDYFWRLKSVDAAGNWSTYGTLRKFWVK